MAILNIPDKNQILQDYDKVRDFLAGINIVYEYWEPVTDLSQDASNEEVLNAYSKLINELKRRGRYVTADVITVNKNTPGLDAMLAKFNIEHRHDEDEVRYILSGRGLFHIHSQQQQRDQVVAIEVDAGDLICIPRIHCTGLIFVVTGKSAQFVCSKMFPVGHLIIHIVLLIENTSQYVGVLDISNHKRTKIAEK
ncbi:MAG: hypothetical protein ACRD4Z_01725 [Nitrososphaeraceae archaeon]